MITAIDTAVLIAIDQAEPTADAWLECLAEARSEGALVICDVVAAEFYATVMDDKDFERTLADLGVQLMATSYSAACLAGKMFRTYRDVGGPRQNLIPDFLVAAHAQADCDRLASGDRGYLRDYFSKLDLLQIHS